MSSIVKPGDLIFVPFPANTPWCLQLHMVDETDGVKVISSHRIAMNEDVLVFVDGEHCPDFVHPKETRQQANAAKRKAKAAAKLETENAADAPVRATKKQATSLAELARKSRERMLKELQDA